MNIDNEAAADVLDEAADYLDTYGWCQGDIGGHGGQRCAFGALNSAGFNGSSQHAIDAARFVALRRARTALIAYIDEHAGYAAHRGSIEKWNDEKGRTQDDVTNGLRKTALTLREQA